ncbi:hypothetical protein [Lentzea albida]|uniref:hypothetical protein n=1 Tax=Lentzea albida TaxID=65499 RepID=UPI000B7F6E08|nr:hypothetical protein [Lentzea albida]
MTLEQIPLGGEAVEQRLLDEQARRFPRARISWIYASTETGAAFAVHDGRAGFLLSWLTKEDIDRPRLRIRNGSHWSAVRTTASGSPPAVREVLLSQPAVVRLRVYARRRPAEFAVPRLSFLEDLH